MSRDIWDELRENKTFIAANRVTHTELAFLEQVELFGNLKTLGDVSLILKNLRSFETSP